jgi:hypothetical protein
MCGTALVDAREKPLKFSTVAEFLAAARAEKSLKFHGAIVTIERAVVVSDPKPGGDPLPDLEELLAEWISEDDGSVMCMSPFLAMDVADDLGQGKEQRLKVQFETVQWVKDYEPEREAQYVKVKTKAPKFQRGHVVRIKGKVFPQEGNFNFEIEPQVRNGTLEGVLDVTGLVGATARQTPELVSGRVLNGKLVLSGKHFLAGGDVRDLRVEVLGRLLTPVTVTESRIEIQAPQTREAYSVRVVSLSRGASRTITISGGIASAVGR